MSKEQLERLKSRFSNLAANPIMDFIGGLRMLGERLNIETFNHKKAFLQNNILAVKKVEFQANYISKTVSLSILQKRDLQQQSIIVDDIDLYLSDYNKESNNTFEGSNNDKELTEKIVSLLGSGELL